MLFDGIKYHEVLWFPVFLSIKYYYFSVSAVLSISLVYYNIHSEFRRGFTNSAWSNINSHTFNIWSNARFFPLKIQLIVLEKVFGLCLHWISEFQFQIGLLGWRDRSVFYWMDRVFSVFFFGFTVWLDNWR